MKDIGALLDWVAGQPDMDPRRVAVTGGSYSQKEALRSICKNRSNMERVPWPGHWEA